MAKEAEAPGSTVAELTAIKRLLILGLMMDGVTQGQLASALGVTQGTVSRMTNGMTKALKKGR
jgi:predicted transcriptional regulator